MAAVVIHVSSFYGWFFYLKIIDGLANFKKIWPVCLSFLSFPVRSMTYCILKKSKIDVSFVGARVEKVIHIFRHGWERKIGLKNQRWQLIHLIVSFIFDLSEIGRSAGFL